MLGIGGPLPSEQGTTLKVSTTFALTMAHAKARVWAGMAYLLRIDSTAGYRKKRPHAVNFRTSEWGGGGMLTIEFLRLGYHPTEVTARSILAGRILLLGNIYLHRRAITIKLLRLDGGDSNKSQSGQFIKSKAAKSNHWNSSIQRRSSILLPRVNFALCVARRRRNET